MESNVFEVSSGDDVSGNDVSAGNAGSGNDNSDVVQAINTLNENMSSSSIDYSPALSQIQAELVEIKETSNEINVAVAGIGSSVLIIAFVLIITWVHKRVKVIMKGFGDNG